MEDTGYLGSHAHASKLPHRRPLGPTSSQPLGRGATDCQPLSTHPIGVNEWSRLPAKCREEALRKHSRVPSEWSGWIKRGGMPPIGRMRIGNAQQPSELTGAVATASGRIADVWPQSPICTERAPRLRPNWSQGRNGRVIGRWISVSSAYVLTPS